MVLWGVTVSIPPESKVFVEVSMGKGRKKKRYGSVKKRGLAPVWRQSKSKKNKTIELNLGPKKRPLSLNSEGDTAKSQETVKPKHDCSGKLPGITTRQDVRVEIPPESNGFFGTTSEGWGYTEDYARMECEMADLVLRVNHCRGGRRTFQHWMFCGSNRRPVVHFWPSTLHYYADNGQKGETSSLTLLIDLAQEVLIRKQAEATSRDIEDADSHIRSIQRRA
jgi:hypothetical protein